MFEDILGPDKPIEEEKDIKIDLLEYASSPICLFCGSSNVDEEGSGIFLSKDRFVQKMVCGDCGVFWNVHYNEDLEVVEVEY